MQTSVDRLTVCGNIDGDIEMFYQGCLDIERKGFAKFPYRDYITFKDGSILQIAEKDLVSSGKIKQLRYEFNPNNSDYEQLHMAVIGLMKDMHYTRVDVAFDVMDVDMKKWKWIDSKARPFRVFYSGLGEVETWYIGGKDSEIQIRVYNKAKEQKKKGVTWWRVEVQFRGSVAKALGESENFTLNPFEGITPVRERDFPELDIKRRALAHYLIDHPEAFSELGSQARAEYRRTIKMLASWECIHFYHVWTEKNSLVQSELKSWSSLARQI